MDDLEELPRARPGHSSVEVDQVLFNPSRRGIELDLLPWCGAHGVPVMAYSPLEQGRILGNPGLRAVAARHGATPAQVALAWILRHDGVSAIPKAGTPAHVEELRAALDLHLLEPDLAELDRAFPRPKRKRPLEMI